MTYEDIRREYEAKKRAGTEFEGLVPVKARVGKDVRVVFSIRLSPTELDRITVASRAAEKDISDFIRSAALTAAAGDIDISEGVATTLQDVREQALALARTIDSVKRKKRTKTALR